MEECKESAKGLDDYKWTIGSEKGVSMEHFWTWTKVDNINGAGDLFSGLECCA